MASGSGDHVSSVAQEYEQVAPAAMPGPPARQPRWGGVPGPPARQPRWGGVPRPRAFEPEATHRR
jgi:hypothetical protein